MRRSPEHDRTTQQSPSHHPTLDLIEGSTYLAVAMAVVPFVVLWKFLSERIVADSHHPKRTRFGPRQQRSDVRSKSANGAPRNHRRSR